MDGTKVEEPTRKPPKRLVTALCIAIYLALSFFRWYQDLPPYTTEEQICWLLGMIIVSLWDLWEAVMYDKTVVIKSIVVNVVNKGDKE